MTQRLRRGAREYFFDLGSRTKQDKRGAVLSPREAEGLVRSMQTPTEQRILRRLGFGMRLPLHERPADTTRRVLDMLARGRLRIRVIEARNIVSGGKKDAEEAVSDAPPPMAPPDSHSVVIELVDAEDNPVPYEPFRIKLPDGRVQTNSLDEHGRARITGIREAGTCMVCFHRRDASVWQPA